MNFMVCGMQADAYKDTGCYNLQCAGFVQTSNSWVIGGTMGAYTTLSSDANFEYNMGVLVIYVSQIFTLPLQLFQIQGHICSSYLVWAHAMLAHCTGAYETMS